MKVLAINGSPRKNGNTASLVESALKGAASCGALTQRIDLSSMRLRPVREEDYTADFDTVKNDPSDDLGIIVSAIVSSDVLIMASPVFFGSITGQLKTMIDRFQFAWLEKNVRGRDVFPEKKRGAFISVQAQDRPDFFNNSSSIVKHFFATVNVSYDSELMLGRLEQRGDAEGKMEYMSKAFQLGKNLAAY